MEKDNSEFQAVTHTSESPVFPVVIFGGWVLAIIAAVALPFGEALFAVLHSKDVLKKISRKNTEADSGR